MNANVICVRHEDAVLNRILDRAPNGYILMGGAARSLYSGEPVKDYDFAFCSTEQRHAFVDHLNEIGAVKVAETRGEDGNKTCEDFRLPFEDGTYAYIQCKCEFYKTAWQVWHATDFTIVQFCYIDGALMASEEAVYDSDHKILRLHHVYGPESTLMRIQRFIEKGYQPANGSAFYAELVRKIRALPENRINKPLLKRVRKEQVVTRAEHG